MDLLYSRYADPLSLLDIYISQGRFGEFVLSISDLEHRRKVEEAELENDRRLWEMYLHSEVRYEKSFNDWKSDILSPKPKKNRDEYMTEDDMANIINDLFPGK